MSPAYVRIARSTQVLDVSRAFRCVPHPAHRPGFRILSYLAAPCNTSSSLTTEVWCFAAARVPSSAARLTAGAVHSAIPSVRIGVRQTPLSWRTDAMPGIVKAFIEALEPLCGRE